MWTKEMVVLMHSGHSPTPFPSTPAKISAARSCIHTSRCCSRCACPPERVETIIRAKMDVKNSNVVHTGSRKLPCKVYGPVTGPLLLQVASLPSPSMHHCPQKGSCWMPSNRKKSDAPRRALTRRKHDEPLHVMLAVLQNMPFTRLKRKAAHHPRLRESRAAR